MNWKNIAMVIGAVVAVIITVLLATGNFPEFSTYDPFSSPPLPQPGASSNVNTWHSNLQQNQIAVTSGGLDHAVGPDSVLWYGYETINGPGSTVGGIEFKEGDPSTNPYIPAKPDIPVKPDIPKPIPAKPDVDPVPVKPNIPGVPTPSEDHHHEMHHKLPVQKAYSYLGVPAMGNFNLNRGAYKTKRLIRGKDWENILLGIPGATPEERQDHLDSLFYPLKNQEKISADDRAKIYTNTPLNDSIGNASSGTFVGDSSWIYNIKRLQDQAA